MAPGAVLVNAISQVAEDLEFVICISEGITYLTLLGGAPSGILLRSCSQHLCGILG